MSSSESLTLPPLASAQGSLTLPGSKSIANRALPLSALASGKALLKNLPGGDDVRYMRDALRSLGIDMEEKGPDLAVRGFGGPINIDQPASLFLGNSGTATRFLTGILSAGKGTFQLDGVPRMRERPVKDLVEGLGHWADDGKSTRINYLDREGFLPIEIAAAGLTGGTATLNGNLSSQFVSAMLLTLPLCKSGSEIKISGELVSKPYVDITLKMMSRWGCEVQNEGFKRFILGDPCTYRNPSEYSVEPDASSASYFLAAGAIGGGSVTVEGLGSESLQFKGEGGFIKILEKMGAKIDLKKNAMTVSGGELRGIEVNMDSMSDTGMTLAIAALFARGPTTISGVANWRHKETDRLHAIAVELRKLGAEVTEGPDYLTIDPPERLQSAEIETYEDHRMAMCFSLAALGGIPITLRNPKCVNKTFPEYFIKWNQIARPLL